MQIETLRREREKAQAREEVHAGKQPLSPIEQVRLSDSTLETGPTSPITYCPAECRRLHQRTVTVKLHAYVLCAGRQALNGSKDRPHQVMEVGMRAHSNISWTCIFTDALQSIH